MVAQSSVVLPEPGPGDQVPAPARRALQPAAVRAAKSLFLARMSISSCTGGPVRRPPTCTPAGPWPKCRSCFEAGAAGDGDSWPYFERSPAMRSLRPVDRKRCGRSQERAGPVRRCAVHPRHNRRPYTCFQSTSRSWMRSSSPPVGPQPEASAARAGIETLRRRHGVIAVEAPEPCPAQFRRRRAFGETCPAWRHRSQKRIASGSTPAKAPIASRTHAARAKTVQAGRGLDRAHHALAQR